MKREEYIIPFHRVLEQYQLRQTVPPDVRRYILLSKSRQFKKILKRTGGYSVLFIIFTNIYFTLKRHGIKVTILQTAAYSLVAIIATTSIIAASLLWFVFRSEKAGDIIIKKVLSSTEVNEQVYSLAPPIEKQSSLELIDDRIGVEPFIPVNVSELMVQRVSDRIASKLSTLRGSERVINLRYGRKGKKSSMILFGSIEANENNYTIYIRLVELKDSRIIHYDRETVSNDAELDSACDRLAERLYSIIH